MEIIVLNDKFEVIAEVDLFSSLIWCERLSNVGAIDLEIEASEENLDIFQIGYFIYRKDTNGICRINQRELQTKEDENDTLIIGAEDLKSITDQVTIQGELDITEEKNVEDWIRSAMQVFTSNDSDVLPKSLYPNFTIENFYLKDKKGFADVTFLLGEKNKKLKEHIIYLCGLFNIGWKITYENDSLYLDLYKGEDRTVYQSVNNRIMFSTLYENLQSSKFSQSTNKMANVAVVLHNNASIVGDNGVVFACDLKDEPTGLNRYDLIVDGSKIVLTENPSADDIVTYKEKLRALGLAKIKEYRMTQKFESVVSINQYKYREDYNLGDIVTVENEYGISLNARIIEVVETWDDTGYSIEPIFDYVENDEDDVDCLITEADEPIMTEVDEYLMYEDISEPIAVLASENEIPIATENRQMFAMMRSVSESESETETETVAETVAGVDVVKISELPEAEGIGNGCCLPMVQDGETKKVYFETIKQGIYTSFEIDKNGHLIINI